MSKNKFTPGKWQISGKSIVAGDICIAVIEDDGGYEAPTEQQDANARLIAAAPAMFGALEAFACLEIWPCVRCDGTGKQPGNPKYACTNCGGTGEMVNLPMPQDIRAARALLARAKGETK